MLEQLKTFEGNTLAFDIIDSFTETDQKFAEKLFEEKMAKGFNQVNVLIKIDELKVSKSSAKAFFEDSLWAIRNYKNLGYIAIVAHSNIIKALIPIDKLFFERASEGRYERYFDISQLEEAYSFVNPNKK